MSTVYILGAGASAFAGYPLASELWPFIRDRSGGEVMAEERRGDVIAEMERLLRVRPPERQDQPDLEALFTLLDLSLMLPGEISLVHADWRLMRQKVVGMIAWSFINFQDDLDRLIYDNKPRRTTKALDRAAVRAVCDAWVERVHEGDTLIFVGYHTDANRSERDSRASRCPGDRDPRKQTAPRGGGHRAIAIW